VRHPRRGTSLIETIIAVVVGIMILGAAWVIYVSATRTGVKVLEYSSVLEASASVQARLVLDVASAYMPPGQDSRTSPLFVSQDGKRVSFFTHKRIDDPENNGPHLTQFRRVVWEAVEEGDHFIIERKPDAEEGQRWETLHCEDVRFHQRFFKGKFYLEADFLFRGSTNEALNSPKTFPLRVVRRLRDPGRLGRTMIRFPGRILTDLPEAREAPDDPIEVTLNMSQAGGS
jgi:hypothetical protein